MFDAIFLKINQAVIALLLTFPVSILLLEDEEKNIIWILALSIILDSILGIVAAIKGRRFSSWKFGQPMAMKVMLYSAALVGALLASHVHPLLRFAFEYLAIYFTLSETLSIFEKLALLGLRIPTRILSMVNELFKKYEKGDKEALRRIILKK